MYSNVKYALNVSGQVNGITAEISGESCFVPLDPANTDYQNIMALVEAGELTIAPAE